MPDPREAPFAMYRPIVDDEPPSTMRYTLPVAAAAIVGLIVFFDWLATL